MSLWLSGTDMTTCFEYFGQKKKKNNLLTIRPKMVKYIKVPILYAPEVWLRVVQQKN